MLQALTSVARLSFSMTLLSRPSSPLSVHLRTRHPSDGLLPRYRKSSATAGLTAAESTSTDTEWSSPARTGGVRACRTDERPARRRYDFQLSPPRERSRSDATAYYRREQSRLDSDGLMDMMCGRQHRHREQMNDVTVADDADVRDDTPHVDADVK